MLSSTWHKQAMLACHCCINKSCNCTRAALPVQVLKHDSELKATSDHDEDEAMESYSAITTCSTFWLDLATGAPTQVPAGLLAPDGSELQLLKLNRKNKPLIWGLHTERHDAFSEDEEVERGECECSRYYRYSDCDCEMYEDNEPLYARCVLRQDLAVHC